MYDINPQGLRRLVDAIILQACEDYKRAVKGTFVDTAHYKVNDSVLIETEAFFRSDLFADMCDIDPEWLMQELQMYSTTKKFLKGRYGYNER